MSELEDIISMSKESVKENNKERGSIFGCIFVPLASLIAFGYVLIFGPKAQQYYEDPKKYDNFEYFLFDDVEENCDYRNSLKGDK